MARCAAWIASRLVFIDESAATTKMIRLYGRALRGQRARDAAPHGHWGVRTIIGALFGDGRTACMTIDAATDGEVAFAGKPLTSYGGKEARSMRRQLQMVFQDPYASLNPVKTIFTAFDEPLKICDRLVFGDMAIYSMVKNNTFNGMPLPHILLLKKEGSFGTLRSFGYEDFKERL